MTLFKGQTFYIQALYLFKGFCKVDNTKNHPIKAAFRKSCENFKSD